MHVYFCICVCCCIVVAVTWKWKSENEPAVLWQDCVCVCISGVLLPELLTCLIIIEKKTPELLRRLNVVPKLHSLLDVLDAFNRCACGLLRDDIDDLSYPSLQGLWSSFPALFSAAWFGVVVTSTTLSYVVLGLYWDRWPPLAGLSSPSVA